MIERWQCPCGTVLHVTIDQERPELIWKKLRCNRESIMTWDYNHATKAWWHFHSGGQHLGFRKGSKLAPATGRKRSILDDD